MLRLYFSKKEQYAIAILLAGVLVSVILLSYAYMHRGGGHAQPTTFYEPAATPRAAGDAGSAAVAPPVAAQADPAPTGLIVHVSGAVKHPGIVTLPPGARVNDALEKAGGATANGYPDALNLAARLEDGEKITIPTKAEWDKANAGGSAPPLVQRDPRAGSTEQTPAATTNPSDTTDSAGAGEADTGSARAGAGHRSSEKNLPPPGRFRSTAPAKSN